MHHHARSAACHSRRAAVLLVLGVLACGQPARGDNYKSDLPPTGVVPAKRICMLNNFIIRDKKEGVPYVHQRKTYYFCCAGCIRRFSLNPTQFSKGIDPVSKKEVDKASASLYAYLETIYYFESATNLKLFSEDPEKYMKGESTKEKKLGATTASGKAAGAGATDEERTGAASATAGAAPVKQRAKP